MRFSLSFKVEAGYTQAKKASERVCELREVARGRAALGRRELGQAASLDETQKKGGRGHPAMPACGVKCLLGP